MYACIASVIISEYIPMYACIASVI
jgi:hypothetical protein